LIEGTVNPDDPLLIAVFQQVGFEGAADGIR
jgi:hypothetical protein